MSSIYLQPLADKRDMRFAAGGNKSRDVALSIMKQMSPKALEATIKSAQDGRGEAFMELLDAYAPRLFGYFLRACGNHHDAEDLLSEMSLKLVSCIKDYADVGRFEPWLFRIAANMVRDRIRRSKTSPVRVSLSAQGQEGRAMADDIAGPSESVDGKIIAEETNAKLNAALARLDETTREMILMRHFAEMSFKEIAKMFECPIGTALAKVHRGLTALREILGNEQGV